MKCFPDPMSQRDFQDFQNFQQDFLDFVSQYPVLFRRFSENELFLQKFLFPMEILRDNTVTDRLKFYNTPDKGYCCISYRSLHYIGLCVPWNYTVRKQGLQEYRVVQSFMKL